MPTKTPQASSTRPSAAPPLPHPPLLPPSSPLLCTCPTPPPLSPRDSCPRIRSYQVWIKTLTSKVGNERVLLRGEKHFGGGESLLGFGMIRKLSIKMGGQCTPGMCTPPWGGKGNRARTASGIGTASRLPTQVIRGMAI